MPQRLFHPSRVQTCLAELDSQRFVQEVDRSLFLRREKSNCLRQAPAGTHISLRRSFRPSSKAESGPLVFGLGGSKPPSQMPLVLGRPQSHRGRGEYPSFLYECQYVPVPPTLLEFSQREDQAFTRTMNLRRRHQVGAARVPSMFSSAEMRFPPSLHCLLPAARRNSLPPAPY